MLQKASLQRNNLESIDQANRHLKQVCQQNTRNRETW